MTPVSERTVAGPDLVLKRRFQILRTANGRSLGEHATVGDAWRAIDEHDLGQIDRDRAVA